MTSATATEKAELLDAIEGELERLGHGVLSVPSAGDIRHKRNTGGTIMVGVDVLGVELPGDLVAFDLDDGPHVFCRGSDLLAYLQKFDPDLYDNVGDIVNEVFWFVQDKDERMCIGSQPCPICNRDEEGEGPCEGCGGSGDLRDYLSYLVCGEIEPSPEITASLTKFLEV